jgi:peroxiredoxin Q/BCP
MPISLQVKDKAPNFSLPDSQGNMVSLQDFLGKWLVIYFYPKDNTPGCTTEALEFSEYLEKFQGAGANIIGVSPDSEKSHGKFIEKHNLTLQLLSDSEQQMAENYGVWGLKKFMGKEYLGIIRSTFLVDPQGYIAHLWKNVKVKGHVSEVWQTFTNLTS